MWSHIRREQIDNQRCLGIELQQRAAGGFELHPYTNEHLLECGKLVLDPASTWLCGWRLEGLLVGAGGAGFALSLLVLV